MEILLYLALICLMVLLIALVEGVALTWLKWAGFRQSLISAAAANLISNLVIVILLVLLEQVRYSHLIVGWIMSSLIESVILHLFRYQPYRRTLWSALVANLASYAVLILPAYYYGQRG